MLVSLALIFLICCFFNANGYPVQSKPSLLLTYLPDNWTVMGQSRRLHPFVVPDPTQTLICRVMLPVLNLSSMMGGSGGGAGHGSLPIFILPGEPQFVLRRRFNHQPDIDIEPWEVLAYTPNTNLHEPDITSLLAAPAPVLCVSPDRPRPHPVLFAPEPPMSPAELRPPPAQRPFPAEGSLYTVQSAPPPYGFPVEPSVNPAILESLIYSAQNKPVFGPPDRVEQSPNGPPPYYKPQHDSTESGINLQRHHDPNESGIHLQQDPPSPKSLLGAKDSPRQKIVPGHLTESEIAEIKEEEKEESQNVSASTESLSGANDRPEQMVSSSTTTSGTSTGA